MRIKNSHGGSGRVRAVILAVVIPLCAAAAVLSALWLTGALPEGFPLCPMLRITGLRCPLCGGTHAVLELLRGRVLSAVRYNPAVVAALLPCVWMYARLVRSCMSSPYRPYRPRLNGKAAAALIITAVVFTIVRNTPVYRMYLY